MSEGSLGAVPRQAPLHAEGAPVPPATSELKPVPKFRSRLFSKYVGLFVAVVLVALLPIGTLAVVFYYREHETSLVRIQREQAEAAAAKIGQFIKEIESQIGWTTQLPWLPGTVEQRRFDGLRLLRQVPAITELTQIDGNGREQLRVSRFAMDVIGSQADLSQEPKFVEAMRHKVYYGALYFHRESEPYMTLALAGARRDAGVSAVEVNLKLIWDVVSQIKVGQRGYAYVVDAQGRLIAHPDSSLVLRNTNVSHLPQVRAARLGGPDADFVQEAANHEGRKVLSAHAAVAPVGWLVFVELPVAEANAPLYGALERLTVVLLAALVFAVFAGVFLAHRMVVPIRALGTGAARIGGGDLSQRIAVETGDELEGLADQFNDMAARLQESYAELEEKVARRTLELRAVLQRLESELAAARQLQQSMVPNVFPAASAALPVEIFASMEPAREVGGDLYDFFYAEDGTLWFMIGDVSGKGMPAALFMARAKSLVRLAVALMSGPGGGAPSPSEVVARVNRELCQDNSQMMFVTLFLGMLETDSGALRFCNGGHSAPYRVNGQALELISGAEGTMLGVQPKASYRTGTMTLAPGECVYLFTDGVVEASNAQGDVFAEERLEAVLRSAAGRSSEQIVQSVADAVRGFVGTAIQSDDITMLAIRRLDRTAS